jgi:hypothetical protein
MPVTLDLPSARLFTDQLNDRLRQCDNGEGMLCSNLDQSINHYVQLCRELRQYVNAWARAVFAGQVAFDPEVENLLKKEMQHLLHRAKQKGALGRAMDEQCFRFEGLDSLHRFIADFDYLLENWVSPRRAVSPTPRVKMPEAAVQEVIQRLKAL